MARFNTTSICEPRKMGSPNEGNEKWYMKLPFCRILRIGSQGVLRCRDDLVNDPNIGHHRRN